MKQTYWALFAINVPFALLLIPYAWLTGLYTVGGAYENSGIVYMHWFMVLVAIGSIVVSLWLKRSQLRAATILLIASPLSVIVLEILAYRRS